MAKSNFTIRRAQASEAQLLSDLSMRSKAHWGYSDEFMEACRAELTYIEDVIRDGYFYVAEVDQSIVGFYGISRFSAHEVELEAMFVEPAYIGRGYGRALIEHAKTTAAGLGYSTMVIQGDPNAERFYRSAGGEITGTRESGNIPGRFLPTFAIALITD